MIKYDKQPLIKKKELKNSFGADNFPAPELYKELESEEMLPTQRPGFIPLVDMEEGPEKSERRQAILEELL